MNKIIESREIKGRKVNVVPDYEPENPREAFDHLGTILYVSNRYNLGDRQVTGEEINDIVNRDDVYWLPVYAHIHGGIVLNTGGHNDPWDSVRV